jgi:hypothetical protein
MGSSGRVSSSHGVSLGGEVPIRAQWCLNGAGNIGLLISNHHRAVAKSRAAASLIAPTGLARPFFKAFSAFGDLTLVFAGVFEFLRLWATSIDCISPRISNEMEDIGGIGFALLGVVVDLLPCTCRPLSIEPRPIFYFP